MGLTSWVKKKVLGDVTPEERQWRKEIEAKAKEKEQEAFKEQYQKSAVEEAEKRGRLRAQRIAEKKNAIGTKSGGGGFLDKLAKAGDTMNRASKGLVTGIEINPNGANEMLGGSVDPFGQSTTRQSSNRKPQWTKPKRKHAEPEFEVVDPLSLDNVEDYN